MADYVESIRYYANEVDLCWGGICESDCFSFDEVIFTQSTGLKDKNGKEIFEGDILEQGINVMSVKKHDTLGFYVDFKGEIEFFSGSIDLEDFEESAKEVADNFEVVGNIWEDGDLIDGKKTSENPEILK